MIFLRDHRCSTLACAALRVTGLAGFLAVLVAVDAVAAAGAPAARFLRADGAVLRDRTGAEVQLRGVNLGGWLEWQPWMCPMDTSKTLRDGNPGHNGYDFEVRKVLVRRFGAAGAESLLNAYQDAWLAPHDLDNIRALGLNVVRLTLGYDTLLRDDGTWRPDAFARMDWLVQQAWQRGLYTIIDYHAFLPPGAEQNGGVNGYWSNAVQQAETVRIWQRIATHYRDNPAIAMYDLLNEPTNSQPTGEGALKAAVVCELYDQLYRAIRAVDPEHVIAMEGMWDWRTLRDPLKSGYRNVVYSFHWYNWGGKTTADRNRATDNDLRAVATMGQAWHVPAFIGEFNLFGDKAAWKYALERYDQQKLSWTLWTYKNTASGGNSWGVYTTLPGKVSPVPDLTRDTADEIRRKWRAWTTSTNTFALNPLFKALLLGLSAPAGALEPEPTRALRDLNKSAFPFTPVQDGGGWQLRRTEIQRRVLVSAGLYPMPEKTPLNAVIHGRVEKDDYTIDKVYFESLPGHFVTGSLYLPKRIAGKIPAVICPHGHWPNGRFMDAAAGEVQKQLALGAEEREHAARSPLQARCVQLARMGCAVLFYDMLGYADSVQFPAHRHGPTAQGFISPEAELNLVSFLGLQTWNSVRVVDFMSSLPYVDTTRIGCTGASGGGTQTLLITGLDDRIAAAFPAVMVSTEMQGGCTCENAPYLRINQGNIDIAALAAPRPLGMTAADDWTKQLETKGFPDLKKLYTLLGVPERVEAHFNLRFPHNYNAVSRAQMYAFFNRHFNLGLTNTAERDFQLLSQAEASVWDAQHPRPAGEQVGEPHERSVIHWFKQQAARQIDPLLQPASQAGLRRTREVLGGALEVMVGRTLPQPGAAIFQLRTTEDKGAYTLQRGATTWAGDSVETTFLYPQKWNHDVILWLSLQDEDALVHPDGQLGAAAARMLQQGYALACPQLYLRGATRNPNVYAPDKRKSGGAYEGFSGYHYGYNPSLFAERVRDALALIGAIRDDPTHRARHTLVAGVEGAGVIAAAATAMSSTTVDRLACDTAGFRFAQLTNVWDVNFVPGAAKYGDVPALLALCAPVQTTVVGETKESVRGVATAFALAKGQLELAGSAQATAVDTVVAALTSPK